MLRKTTQFLMTSSTATIKELFELPHLQKRKKQGGLFLSKKKLPSSPWVPAFYDFSFLCFPHPQTSERRDKNYELNFMSLYLKIEALNFRPFYSQEKKSWVKIHLYYFPRRMQSTFHLSTHRCCPLFSNKQGKKECHRLLKTCICFWLTALVKF